MGARPRLLASLRVKPAAPLELSGWIRIVDYRYCLMPLSPAGSLRGIGARFNIGADLRASGFNPWPALYLAENFETAFREKFQIAADATISGLTPAELALQLPGGFTVMSIRGRLDSVLDLGDAQAIKPFCDEIARFTMPRKVRELARLLNASQPQLIRNPRLLQKAVLSPKWRAIPTQFDLLAPSQIFGGLAKDSGYEAIVYSSARNHQRCAVIFPDNLVESESYVELAGDYPPEVEVPRLDRTTWPRVQQNLLAH